MVDPIRANLLPLERVPFVCSFTFPYAFFRSLWPVSPER